MMDRERLLIAGASGFLGAYAVHAAQSDPRFHVICGDRDGTYAGNAPGAETVKLDIADSASVDRAFREARPDCVLLLAAISDIDRCEALPELAFAVNARGAERVANACVRCNARLLYTSSAAVFDGDKRGYTEEDEAAPISVYGKTKLWAEQAVASLLPSAIVIRFALVLGFAHKLGTNAMLNTLMARWHARETVSFAAREERNPIDAASLSSVMIRLLGDRALHGIYHAGALDSLSRYALGLRLAARAGVSAEFVRPQYEPVPGRAPRGRTHFLLTDKLRNACNIDSGNCEQVIERCFA